MTDREQLIEMRKVILTERMQGQSQADIDRTLRNFARMDFKDHADFMTYVDETTGTESQPSATKATDAELDAIAEHMGFGASMETGTPAAGKATSSEMEEVFKYLNI